MCKIVKCLSNYFRKQIKEKIYLTQEHLFLKLKISMFFSFSVLLLIRTNILQFRLIQLNLLQQLKKLKQLSLILMGLNSSTGNKITIDEKLQFLQSKPIKTCTLHKKDSIMYCSIPNCEKSPYLCQECIKQSVHTHQQGIYTFNGFLKAIVELIEVKKIEQLQNSQSLSSDSHEDLAFMQKQTTKLVEQVDVLQGQILSVIIQYKAKLQANIDRISNKISNEAQQSKKSAYINFYHNPNILANKLFSESNDKFLIQLKRQLRSGKKKPNTIKEQEILLQLKNQLGTVKSKIRDLLNITNMANLVKKNSINTNSIFNPLLKKSIPLPFDSVSKMHLCGNNVYLSNSKEIYSMDTLNKDPKKLLSQLNTMLISKKQGQQFVGLNGPNKLFLYDGRSNPQFNLQGRVSSVNLLKSKRKSYALLGEQQGIFNIMDLQKNKTIFFYRCGDQPISFIQICEAYSTIYCAGKRSPIYIFKYKSKMGNIEQGELDFEYIVQMNPSLIPLGQLQLMRINNSDLYLFGPCRNVVIFDLMLNTEIIRTEYSKKCSSFLDAQFISFGDFDYMISINQGEDFLNVWQIDKMKRAIKLEQILKQKSDKQILSIICVKCQLWLLRENQTKLEVFALSPQ